jgi:hypothetical protein
MNFLGDEVAYTIIMREGAYFMLVPAWVYDLFHFVGVNEVDVLTDMEPDKAEAILKALEDKVNKKSSGA